MTTNSERIESMLYEKRIKMHVFEPSKMIIWTAVGFGKEYWLDPDSGYCSCPGFYFGHLNDKKRCYHLDSLVFAKKENKIETITFSDDEYDDFVSGLTADLCHV